MKRAALCIGVDRAGNLPVLKDAAASARRFANDWASKQDMLVVPPITDDAGTPVTAKAIKDAIRDVLKPANIEQLIVYFAGHGVNVRMGEYWLLSGAPDDSQEAVNVRGSEDLARYCGVPHVIFISDACRTAADTIQAQNVTGSEIFPNQYASSTQKPVDLFYACALGRPAHEIRDASKSASLFKAVYTEELLDALLFKHPALGEWSGSGSSRVCYIRPRPLRDHLAGAIAQRIRDHDLAATVVQEPDAHISSDPTAWMSRSTAVPPARPAAPAMSRGSGGAGAGVGMARATRGQKSMRVPTAVVATPSPRALSRSIVDMALSNPSLARSAIPAAPSLGPGHFETHCGFKVFGARLAGAFGMGIGLEALGQDGTIVRVGGATRPGSPTLLVLESGAGIVLPAVPEFIAALTVDDGEVIDVSYEPSDNTSRWHEYRSHAEELRTLRSVISAATRAGTFRLEGGGALEMARRLQYSKAVDPSLAVYAAYAYNDLHRLDLLRNMDEFMAGDLGASFFDVAFLSRSLDGKSASQRPRVLGFAPMLAQGWAYLRARRVAMPDGLADLPGTLLESVWTLFSSKGVDLLRNTIFRGAQPWRVV